MPAFARFVSLALLASSALASPYAKPKTIKAAAKPRYFAAALAASHIYNTSDPTFASLAAKEYDGATPENEMKWCVCFSLQGFHRS
jgi:GH35 family endo-1,4-beta-xylanase